MYEKNLSPVASVPTDDRVRDLELATRLRECYARSGHASETREGIVATLYVMVERGFISEETRVQIVRDVFPEM